MPIITENKSKYIGKKNSVSDTLESIYVTQRKAVEEKHRNKKRQEK